MILSFLLSFAFASQLCNTTPNLSTDFENLEKDIEKKMRAASHLVPIAKEADSILSKLITNKSPILMNWLEKRKLLSSDEQTIANEWRYYYLDQFILSQFPTANPSVNTSVEKLFSDINQAAFSGDVKKKLSKSFALAKKDTLAYINNLKIDEISKKEILSRLSTVELYWFDKLKGSRFQNKPFEFLKWGVAYDPPSNQINVGIFARKYADDETIYSVWVHEMAHAIDPCRWGAFLKSKNPFEKLYLCLREKESTGALARDDAKMKAMIEQKKLSQEMADSLLQNPYCNRSFYPPEGTQKEQLLEVFADWFSAEVLAISSLSLKNIRTDLCLPQEIMKGSSYLTNIERLERIYSVQPILKKKLKLSSEVKYCPLESISQ